MIGRFHKGGIGEDTVSRLVIRLAFLLRRNGSMQKHAGDNH